LEPNGATQAEYRGDVESGDDRSVGELVAQISENASTLIREEIELAKAEVEEKIRRLAQGAIVAGAAGFFVLLGIIFFFEFGAWGLNRLLDSLWLGFAIVTVALFVFAGLAALIAYRSFQAGAPPVPDKAIEEARLIKEALEHPEVQAAQAASEKDDSQ
jgi:hypothetical protein